MPLTTRKSAQGYGSAPFFFEDFSHSERLFEIKPPLYSVPLKILLIMNQLNFCMDFVAI